MTIPNEPKVELSGISKSFPGVRALHKVALRLYPGEVTALIGENGAGKSTLVKTMTGIYQPESGEIVVDGSAVHFANAEAAIRSGITAIHQETVLFDELSVAENIFLGHAPRNRFGLVNWAAMNARAAFDSVRPVWLTWPSCRRRRMPGTRSTRVCASSMVCGSTLQARPTETSIFSVSM